jgi:uncharacterized protein (DUF1684 family)
MPSPAPTATASDAPDLSPDALAAEVAAWEAWRAKRDQSLRSPDGWLTLIGLFWLEGGPERVGADPALEIPLPSAAAPSLLGTLTPGADGQPPRFTAAPGLHVTLGDDPDQTPRAGTLDLLTDAAAAPGAPTILRYGPLSMHVIQRGDRQALRVKDRDSPTLHAFQGVPAFPYDPAWRVRATLDLHPAPQTLDVPTAIGTVEPQPSPGVLRFVRDGQPLALHPVGALEDEALFVIFSDATSGAETYGAGRFLSAERAPDGAYTLDFNRAYAPPCAFTPYATCPRPPRENRLPVHVYAGEQTP